MDYYLLTDLAARVGYHLALSGAETFRVEETIRRIIGAYGIECEAFSIPNCVMVSLEAANGKPLMVMKRVDFHGNDLESVEKLNALSRRICAETPDPSVAAQWLDETLKGRRHYSVPVYYLGNFCAAAGFCPVFGGTLRDSLFAGLLGLIIGFVSRQMDRRETNPFFSTIVEAFAMAVPAYLAAGFHLVDYIDFVIIGTLMILVPGLLITTSMRDIIYGDTNSGINRIVQVLLSAFAIALGTAAAWRVTSGVYGLTVASGSASYPAWAQAVMIFVACTGFFILFNVHDWGSILCALGGVFTWMTYLLCRDLGMSIYSMNFFAAVVSALYSELMARSRKYPVTSYLVISLLPLVPGAGIYYTMSLGLGGDVHTYNFGVNGSYYWNLRGDTIFSINAGAATVDSYGNHDVPIFERLYLGGPYNMRGFRFRDVAPYNPALSGDETMGGRSSFFCQFEYSIPVIEEVRVAVFYDIGFVNGDSFDFSTSKIVSDYGIGLRLNLPIGPLAVDYAIPIQKNNAIDRGGQFQFYLNYSY